MLFFFALSDFFVVVSFHSLFHFLRLFFPSEPWERWGHYSCCVSSRHCSNHHWHPLLSCITSNPLHNLCSRACVCACVCVRACLCVWMASPRMLATLRCVRESCSNTQSPSMCIRVWPRPPSILLTSTPTFSTSWLQLHFCLNFCHFSILISCF